MKKTASQPSDSWVVAKLATRFGDKLAPMAVAQLVRQQLSRQLSETYCAELPDVEIMIDGRCFWFTNTIIDNFYLLQEVDEAPLPIFVLVPSPQHPRFSLMIRTGLPYVAFTADDINSQQTQRQLEAAALSALLQLID